MPELLGDDLRLYWDNASAGAGNYTTPTWAGPQTSVGDMAFDPNQETPEIPKRILTKVYAHGRGDWRLTFTCNYDPSNNTFHKKVRDSIISGARVHLAFAEGPIASADYYHAWWLLKGPTNASLDEAATIEVEAMPHTSMGALDVELPAFVDAV